MKTKIKFREALLDAFPNALEKEIFSYENEKDSNYVGHFMYMYSDDTHDFFKNINSRKYVKVSYK